MNPTLHDIQLLLKQRGYSLGSSGPGRDGVDGVGGDLTYAAVLAELKRCVPLSSVPEPIRSAVVAMASDGITARVVLELVHHEAIICEAYKDSKGVWTWAVGVTSASGHSVERYKDHPQPLEFCLQVSIWLMRTKYLPEVIDAFEGRALSEHQLAAALSFHYNTGAIGRASWVKAFKAGSIETARSAFMEWRKPPEIVKRREAERDLFFDGRWAQDGRATVYPVSKPSYSPKWSGAERVDVRGYVAKALQS